MRGRLYFLFLCVLKRHTNKNYSAPFCYLIVYQSSSSTSSPFISVSMRANISSTFRVRINDETQPNTCMCRRCFSKNGSRNRGIGVGSYSSSLFSRTKRKPCASFRFKKIKHSCNGFISHGTRATVLRNSIYRPLERTKSATTKKTKKEARLCVLNISLRYRRNMCMYSFMFK